MSRAAALRSPTVLVGGLGALVGLVFAILLFRSVGARDVPYGPLGYTVQSDRSVRVVFEVDKDPQQSAVCVVRSRDRDGAEVGRALVPVGPSAERRQVVTHDLPTTARANTGEVTGCALEGAAP